SGNEAGRITFDTTGPIGGTSSYYEGGGKGGKQLVESSPAASYRFAGFYHEGGTQIDLVDHERIFLAPSVTFHLGEDTDLTVYATYQRDEGGDGSQLFPLGLTVLPNPLGHIDNSVYLGEPDFNQFDRTQFNVGYEFDHRFDDVWSISHRFRYSHLDSATKFVNALWLNPDFRTARRIGNENDTDTDAIQFDTRLVAEFETGATEHTAFLGFDYLRQESRYNRLVQLGGIPTIDAFNPVYSGTASFARLPYVLQILDGVNDTEQVGLYAQDQIAIGNWRASLGGRYDWSDQFTSGVRNRVPESATTKAESFTGRAGLLYLFDSGIAPYTSYATSFEPVGGTDFFGAPFDPTTGQQFEA
ncbi:MAG TPA: TonB-dependent receptor, partial [Bacteroidia bacterium]|nr:TonB-dependent receptor [Bacteroidia bacterium]